ncbi:DUF5107 domain-containing protein [Proteiniclasticum ruminis]|uniref:NMDA receptor-regulated protein 1 n=1 Tax=Proteiniclasticum ruminis TaxID=398199 RepID=A0A1G8K249_9CLOT|nr:DUF5107 domain-containing protein [Proteiniclasticum ruminis]SDI37501.1 NMDA receptor-regulated protein 1 [Proteiniclasticum ruminis]
MSTETNAKVWVDKITIPTYPVGKEEKNPIFLDQRVYQGSTGKVYPYAVIESIADEKVDREYTVVYLENEYLKVMILPELGGRIQRAIDKTNGYDFLYYNQVIKPALVGLLGPWISGGIEFNWPQHHRPTTFMPVDYKLNTYEDGSASVVLMDHDRMYGTKVNTEIKLYKDYAYIEIEGQLYNGTSFPQTFLWWANPAIPANEHTQSIFPPDVHAVMDHGKRDVSRFPIATGEYYKYDYSEGVDISYFKNIPVPTSYMAEKSKFDFMGGYDHKKRAGLLHVADHQISPGKKQWTWGNGDFGQAWDRNLTDEDGSYIELMTGVYTDNQPDFTWLKPFERKNFKQYFMPYKELGAVKNASTEVALNILFREGEAEILLYGMKEIEKAVLEVFVGSKLAEKKVLSLSPREIRREVFPLAYESKEEVEIFVKNEDGEVLLSYKEYEQGDIEIPEPAKASEAPEKIMTLEELYLTGLHLEQYRHATFKPEDYYLEGLKRDPLDSRINEAFGVLLFRRGDFENARIHLKNAVKRLTSNNPNPYHSEPLYHLGVLELYYGDEEAALDYFHKAAWSSEQQERAYYYLALLYLKQGKLKKAQEHIDKAITKNTQNIKAQSLKAVIMRKLGDREGAREQISLCRSLDAFDVMARFENSLWSKEDMMFSDVKIEPWILTAFEYGLCGCLDEAVAITKLLKGRHVLAPYYEAYFVALMGREQEGGLLLKDAKEYFVEGYFPNRLEDQIVLEWAVAKEPQEDKARHLLGTLYYDKKQYDKAYQLWVESLAIQEEFPTVHRNLSLLYFNQRKEKDLALKHLERAFQLDASDARVLFELDQLYKKLNRSPEERYSYLNQHLETVYLRDDLLVEYITLLNMRGEPQRALEILSKHQFHPWEGGEGKVTGQYKASLLLLAQKELCSSKMEEASELLKRALVYPENLGEGKLDGSKDNDIYYYLGLCAEGFDENASKVYFEKATLGADHPAGVLYYNDQPAHMILFQGLALEKLGRLKEARKKYFKLLDYAERHHKDEVSIDFFAVSLPDFLVFEEDWTKRNRIHCTYLKGLAYIGFKQDSLAEEALEEVLALQENHADAVLMKNLIVAHK